MINLALRIIFFVFMFTFLFTFTVMGGQSNFEYFNVPSLFGKDILSPSTRIDIQLFQVIFKSGFEKKGDFLPQRLNHAEPGEEEISDAKIREIVLKIEGARGFAEALSRLNPKEISYLRLEQVEQELVTIAGKRLLTLEELKQHMADEGIKRRQVWDSELVREEAPIVEDHFQADEYAYVYTLEIPENLGEIGTFILTYRNSKSFWLPEDLAVNEGRVVIFDVKVNGGYKRLGVLTKFLKMMKKEEEFNNADFIFTQLEADNKTAYLKILRKKNDAIERPGKGVLLEAAIENPTGRIIKRIGFIPVHYYDSQGKIFIIYASPVTTDALCCLTREEIERVVKDEHEAEKVLASGSIDKVSGKVIHTAMRDAGIILNLAKILKQNITPQFIKRFMSTDPTYTFSERNPVEKSLYFNPVLRQQRQFEVAINVSI
ncbi:MAG: hypothetical protein KJ893_00290 [Candidatus Omnitrophica bacterium]|nr:hypothetical protein [Candidatus Omnitrophota bacterium]MCG2704332.1 hypothetical protein [Candidatus Omnitrophota bacterium]